MEGHEDPQRGSPGRQRRSEAAVISDGLHSELVLSYLIPGLKTNIFRELPFSVVPLQKGAAPTREFKTARLSKGFVCFRKSKGKTQEKGSPDPQQGRRQEELQVARDGHLLLWKRPLYLVSAETQLP